LQIKVSIEAALQLLVWTVRQQCTVYVSMLFMCTATILSDVNCKFEWVLHLQDARSVDEKKHRSASTLVECQKACEFDPRCVAIDWKSKDRHCDLNTNPDHAFRGGADWDHYELVSRCNITLGQCSANTNILKIF